MKVTGRFIMALVILVGLTAAMPRGLAQEAAPAPAAPAETAAVKAPAAADVDALRETLLDMQTQMERLRTELQTERGRTRELEQSLKALQERLQQVPTSEEIEKVKSAVQDVRGEVGNVQASLEKQQVSVQGAEQIASMVQKQMEEATAYRFGGSIRLRGAQFGNVWTFNDDFDYDEWKWYRLRTWIWFDAQVSETLKGHVTLANEYRYGDAREEDTLAAAAARNAQMVYGNKQVFIENAYIDWKFDSPQPISLRLGRQPLVYGEGFVILDGMPFIGSTGLAFDALKATWKPRDDTSVDFFTAKTAEGAEKYHDDEDLYGIYVTNKTLEKHTAEFYLLYKDKNRQEVYGAPDPGLDDPARGQAIVSALLQGTPPPGWVPSSTLVDPEMETWVLGTRWSGSVTEQLSYAAEVAGQGGTVKFPEGDKDRKAWAGYVKGSYSFQDVPLDPVARLAAIYYSGDDPDSGDYEGWDSMYGDWPKYSELYIYQLYDPFFILKQGNDPDLGTWSNMSMFEAGVDLKPSKKDGIAVNYYYILANEDTGPGDGDTRGNFVQVVWKHRFTPNLSGHLWGEYFDPGDYYRSDADPAWFGRWTMQLDF